MGKADKKKKEKQKRIDVNLVTHRMFATTNSTKRFSSIKDAKTIQKLFGHVVDENNDNIDPNLLSIETAEEEHICCNWPLWTCRLAKADLEKTPEAIFEATMHRKPPPEMQVYAHDRENDSIFLRVHASMAVSEAPFVKEGDMLFFFDPGADQPRGTRTMYTAPLADLDICDWAKIVDFFYDKTEIRIWSFVDDKEYKMHVARATSVLQIKRRLAKVLHVKHWDLVVTANDREMDDDRAAKDFNTLYIYVNKIV